MARPKVLADNDVRNSIITVRVTEDVFLELQKIATREETSISTMIYELVIMSAERKITNPSYLFSFVRSVRQFREEAGNWR